jgi:hypothetical protein
MLFTSYGYKMNGVLPAALKNSRTAAMSNEFVPPFK